MGAELPDAPLIVFINSRSGGRAGARLMQVLCHVIGHVQARIALLRARAKCCACTCGNRPHARIFTVQLLLSSVVWENLCSAVPDLAKNFIPGV
jgi:hypothetical protein